MKKRILASVLVLVMLICLLPVTAIADGNEGWTVNDEKKTVMIYSAEGLRAWAKSITEGTVTKPNYGCTRYDGFTVSIENDIDLSGTDWTSIIGLGGEITIDGKGHTISNMWINEQDNVKVKQDNVEVKYTFLGFIGHIAYGTRLTIKNITFENAHVQDPGGDSQYSWAAVVVGHGPMDCFYNFYFDKNNKKGKWTTPCDNATCTFENITVKNSVVTGAHNTAAILGYSSSRYDTSHLFDHCSVIDTFIGGGYAQGSGATNTAAILFCMGHANVKVTDCFASGVLLYSDGLTSQSNPYLFTNYNSDLWLGTLYNDYWIIGNNCYVRGTEKGEVAKAELEFSDTNTATNCAIVYPVVFHYSNNTDIKEYVRVNTPLKGTWYAKEDYTMPVTQIDGATRYPRVETREFENDEAYETQDTSNVANPLTHAVIHLYTKEEYVPEQSTSDYLIPGLWLNTNDHYSYLIGYSDGTVRPNGKITRAEVATIFFRLLDDDTRAKYWSSKNDFSDVSADKWYNNAVSTLSNMGVIGGYADGTFRPDAPISRAEFAKIAVSFTQNNGSAVYNYFTDVKTTDWFAPYVTAAKDAGLIEGYSDGSFKPESKITRAEACAIVNRTLGRKPSKAHMKISDRIDWPDVQTTDWFYEAIMEATNSHTYQMGKRVETWNDKLPQRDWAALETGWANAYTGNGGEVR